MIGMIETITWVLYDNGGLYDITVAFEDGILHSIRVDKGICHFYVVYSEEKGWIGGAKIVGVTVDFNVSEEDMETLIHEIRRELMTSILVKEEFKVW